jgi:MoxR-like ATPase
LISILTGGHVLLEGVPGLAKTLTVRTLAETIDTTFHRIQFTPDLLPADVLGTQVYDQSTGQFSVKRGPIFANIILADEINRAPAKVQSALLEAMQERQVTIGEKTYPLSDPFLVLATQNPLEQEGTYQLPEAQLDRFMLKLNIGYPQKSEERQILDLMATSAPDLRVDPVIDPKQIIAARDVVNQIYIDERVKDYIVDVVWATREPASYNLSLEGLIRYGASPRATIYLALGARAHAFLNGRGYVTPQDVKSIGPDVLRHRIIVSYEAEAESVTSETIIERIFAGLPVP